MEGKRRLVNLGLDGRIILKLIFLKEMYCVGVDWIYLTVDRDRCRAFVNTVMNVRVPYNYRISTLAERSLVFRSELRCVQ